MAGAYERARVVDFLASINRTNDEKLQGYFRLYPILYRENECSGDAFLLKSDYGRSSWIDLEGQLKAQVVHTVDPDSVDPLSVLQAAG